MKPIPKYRSRLPLFLYALIDLTFPLFLLYGLHALLLDQAWLEKYTWLGGLAGIAMVIGVRLLRGYSRYSERSIAQKLALIFKVWMLTVLLLIFLAFLHLVAQDYSRKLVISWAIITPFVLLLLRLLVNRFCYAVDANPIRVVLLEEYAFTDFERSRLAQQNVEFEVLAFDEQADWLQKVRDTQPDYVLLNTHQQPQSDLIKDLTHLELDGVRLIKMEQFMETFLRKCYVDYQTVNLDYLQEVTAYSRLNYALKRMVDVSAALSLLLLTWPVMIYAMIRIRQESPGPVIFSQKRVGLFGKEFTLYKFRSMHLDAEKEGAKFAEKDDPRAYGFGAFMRKTRIDELPQLWNVLKGDIHFIGPRPERKVFTDELEKDIPFYHERHLVAPGISGWAQVMYPYGSCVEDARQKLMYDLYYIKNWSIWLEIETLIRTVGVVLGKKGL
ncbi:polyprenyl glycosylphosphotransferase [Thiomicrospira aerophila AL3]|uniref:Polyprenyl glycosylphosphotransferase n=1 Tax=Thiomicrospira aerophila AL3 TaxID=717772 RepID=W0DVX1_9GAMM|nr:exopolysaccharide biosynthesis polyprenyl glycosylphosphotransferase [Thiomicrospira aerophila]AHF01134.1 polyprenyl glycosylphosphotransferase [Thiomicrospira aerophila AL3]